jgi:hypothetical protein
VISLAAVLPIAAGCIADPAVAGSEATATDDVVADLVGDSAYSSVEGCEVTHEDDLGGAVHECEGVGPYRLSLARGDLRVRAP